MVGGTGYDHLTPLSFKAPHHYAHISKFLANMADWQKQYISVSFVGGTENPCMVVAPKDLILYSLDELALCFLNLMSSSSCY